MIRVVAFDLGVEGALARMKRTDEGGVEFLSSSSWDFSSLDDQERFHRFGVQVRAIVGWADFLGYEQVQFNRGKSLIPGMEGILIDQSAIASRMVHGVNVATLKKFALQGRFKKSDPKNAMQKALAIDWPEIFERLTENHDTSTNKGKNRLNNKVDACWVALWMLEHVETLDA